MIVLLIKENLELVTIHCYSDQSAIKHKIFKNLMNLCFHRFDFGFKCNKKLFVTSCDKSTCEDIEGTLKKQASPVSLQRPP